MTVMGSASASAQMTPQTQMEKLDRGLIVLPAKTGQFISWRFLGTDDEGKTSFDVLRNGQPLTSAKNLYVTSYNDIGGNNDSEYQVVTKISGEPVDTTAVVKSWGQDHMTIKLDRPANGTGGCTYTPNDCSVGDVDGDGQYELFLKWDPSNSQDNSKNGTTGNVYIDCYKFDGTKLWRIDLGPNIRAGAHYSQFMVYDFDGDGCAEMMVKTAPGSKDGSGTYVNQAATDATIKGHSNSTTYRNSNGHVIQGPEYLTVFNGLTGQAVHTTWYLPNRAGTGGDNESGDNLGKAGNHPSGSTFWGDSYGGRSERYLAGVAYVNGPDERPCGIFSRGYYTRAYVWAVSFDGTRLHTEWLHASPNRTQSVVFGKYDPSLTFKAIVVDGDSLQRKGLKTAAKNTSGVKEEQSEDGIVASNTMFGNGNHNLSIADVDGDGCDEIIWGAAALDHDGTMLYATGLGHGDAIHMSDLLPDRPGLEVYQIHEEKLKGGFGAWDLHDAATGEIIYKGGSDGVDNGRGMAADISADYRGFEFWSYDDNTPRRADNGKYTSGMSSQSSNFRLYWNGDLYDELLDGHYARNSNNEFDHVDQVNITTGDNNRIQQWTNRSLCNTTKMTPNLSADILGDWREEIVLWDYQQPDELYIHSTNIATSYRMPTLMHDHTYRMGVCWQNTAYNQPPHLGYFLPDAMLPHLIGDKSYTVVMGEPFSIELSTQYTLLATLSSRLKPGGGLATDISGKYDSATKSVTISGTPTLLGDYTIAFKLTGRGGSSNFEVITISSVESSNGISNVKNGGSQEALHIYDAAGRLLPHQAIDQLPKGLYLIKQGNQTKKTLIK